MIRLFDTTLRDGAQAEGITFSLDDKKKIIGVLDTLGVAIIEAGNPGANPKDEELFASLKKEAPLRFAKLAAFGSTVRPGMAAADDPALRKMTECGADVLVVFGKCSRRQVETVLHCTHEENLRMIRDTVSYLKRAGREVFFDAEHFFDAYKEDPAYAMETVRAAAAAGADQVTLCDTKGGSFPEEIVEAVRAVIAETGVTPGIHCHNDCGLAVACTLAAVRAGCDLVQGTMGGIGERCGNLDLCTLIPLLEMKLNLSCLPSGHLNRLTHAYRVIQEIMNLSPDERAPFVGNSAFAHKAGMHIDAVIKDAASYEHIDPEAVGNQRRFLLSDQSGKAGVYARLGRVLPDLNADSPEIRKVIAALKEKEAEGYTYENADGSFALLALDTLGRRPKFFDVADFHVVCSRPEADRPEAFRSAQAYLKVSVHGEEGINAAEGDGPVNALDLALRKTLAQFYPCLSRMRLRDFKVRVLNSLGTASKVRVSIESSDGQHLWNTVGVNDDIIRACLSALVDSVDYLLTFYATDEEKNMA